MECAAKFFMPRCSRWPLSHTLTHTHVCTYAHMHIGTVHTVLAETCIYGAQARNKKDAAPSPSIARHSQPTVYIVDSIKQRPGPNRQTVEQRNVRSMQCSAVSARSPPASLPRVEYPPRWRDTVIADRWTEGGGGDGLARAVTSGSQRGWRGDEWPAIAIEGGSRAIVCFRREGPRSQSLVRGRGWPGWGAVEVLLRYVQCRY